MSTLNDSSSCSNGCYFDYLSRLRKINNVWPGVLTTEETIMRKQAAENYLRCENICNKNPNKIKLKISQTESSQIKTLK